MEYVLFMLGICIGALIMCIIHNHRAGTGVLRVDHSDPNKDLYRFEIDELDKLDKKKRLNIKIDHHADLSQK